MKINKKPNQKAAESKNTAPSDATVQRDLTRQLTKTDGKKATEVEFEEDIIFNDSAKEVQISKINRAPTLNTFITGTIKTAVYLTCVLIVSIFLAISAIQIGNDVFALVKEDFEIELTIEEGISVKEAAKLFYDNKIIKYPGVFEFFAKLKDVDPEMFVAGTYKVSPTMNYERLCKVFIPRKEREIVRLTIPEGSTVNDIINIFTEEGIGTREGFIKAINEFDYSEYFDFIPEVYAASTADRIYRLEGYLYPDTYDFYSDAKESQIIYKLLENFNSKFSEQMKKDAKEAGYTMDEIITIASIVQKEAYYYEDLDQIASVFFNRLKNKGTYPKLESDATTVYAIELATGKRPEKLGEAELAFNSPYNTRVYNGLTPGAICSPGYDALMCTIYPASTKYYYFVADKDGHNIYSRTYDEHKKAVAAVIADES